MQSINKTLEYHELLMTLDNIESIKLDSKLPEGFKYVFYSDEKDKIEWAKIHISSGEFTSYKRTFNYFDIFYKEFENELNKEVVMLILEGTDSHKFRTVTLSEISKIKQN